MPNHPGYIQPIPKVFQLAIKSIQNPDIRPSISYEYLEWILGDDVPRRDEVYRTTPNKDWTDIILQVPKLHWGTVCLSCGDKRPYGATVLHQCPLCLDSVVYTKGLLEILAALIDFPVDEIHRFILDMEFKHGSNTD